MTLAVYLHQLDPFALKLWGDFGIRWYGLSYVAGFMAAYLVLYALAKRGKIMLKPEVVGDFIVAMAIGTVVGGRIGYCLFYRTDLLTDFSGRFPFWGVLAMWEGGMASHGGIIGLALACVWFGRKQKVTPFHLFDLIALSSPIGIFFGRLANFVNGELLGRDAPQGLPWAVKFPQEMHDWSRGEIGRLHEVVNAVGFDAEPGVLADRVSRSRFVQDVIEKIQEGHRAVTEAVEPLLIARHPSQIYEAMLEGVLLLAALWLIWWKPRKPGVIGGWFMVLYAIGRIAGEQFRLPDTGIGYQALGLTRGQWLSAVMLVIGVVCLTLWSRRAVERIGGWKEAKREAQEAAA